MSKDRTIGSGGDDASISAWEAQIDDSTDENGTCIESANLGSTSLSFNAANTARLYKLSADAGSQVAAPTQASMGAKARVVVTSGDAITVTTDGWWIERIGVDCGTGGGQAIVTSKNLELHRLVVRSVTASLRVTAGTVVVGNCAFIIQTNVGAFTIYSDGGTTTLRQSSIRGRSSGLTVYNGSGVSCYGCIAGGGGGGGAGSDYFGSPGGDYNVAMAATVPGANSYNSVSDPWVNSTDGTIDMALIVAAQGAYVSSDFSGDDADLTTDLVGTSRTGTIDIGVWQTPAAPAGGQPTARRFALARGFGRPVEVGRDGVFLARKAA